MIGAIVGGIIAGAGSMTGSLISAMGAKKAAAKQSSAINKAAKLHVQEAERSAARQVHYSDVALAKLRQNEERTKRHEQTRLAMLFGYGTPGTYEQSYEDFYSQNLRAGGGGSLSDASGIFDTLTKKVTTTIPGIPKLGIPSSKKTTKVRTDVLNPEQFQTEAEKSRLVRMVSFDIAQADQLSRQEGPLYIKLRNAVQGPIIEGAGMQHQTIMEAVSRAAAQKGSARNRAIQFANKMEAAETVARDRQNALWQSNLALTEMGISNRRGSIGFALDVTDSLVRDTFNAQMNSFGQTYIDSILPTQLAIEQNLLNSRQAAADMKLQAETVKANTKRDMYALLGGAVMASTATVGGALTKTPSTGSSPVIRNPDGTIWTGGNNPYTPGMFSGYKGSTGGIS